MFFIANLILINPRLLLIKRLHFLWLCKLTFSFIFLFSTPDLFLSFFSSSDNCLSRCNLGLDFLEGLFIEILFLLLFSFTDWNKK